METDRQGKNEAIAVMRWSARVLGVLTAGFFLFMFIGESLESHPGAEPTPLIGWIGLGMMGIYVVAMFLALKWEHVGSLLGVAGLGCLFIMLFFGLSPVKDTGGFSPKGVLNPFLLAFWLPILLYLLCWGLEGRGGKKAVLKPTG